MRPALVERMKTDIRTSLQHYLHEENVHLYIAANDNGPLDSPHVTIEAIEDSPLEGSRLLSACSASPPAAKHSSPASMRRCTLIS